MLPKFVSMFLTAIVVLTSPFCTLAQDVDFELEEGVIISEVVEPKWEGSFGAGLNGKTGNSQNVDINMTLNLGRETEITETKLLANYFYGSNDVATITDRAFGQFRQERKLTNPKFSLYYQGALEWDRFKNYDYRIALHSGLAYSVFKNDDGLLKLRFGAGASKEVGSVNDEWLPELQFGADWERQISESTKIYANVDYYPNIQDFSDYRVNTNTGLNFLLDAERNINFRIFALNRFDSTPPPGNNQNDLDYGMSIIVGF